MSIPPSNVVGGSVVVGSARAGKPPERAGSGPSRHSSGGTQRGTHPPPLPQATTPPAEAAAAPSADACKAPTLRPPAASTHLPRSPASSPPAAGAPRAGAVTGSGFTSVIRHLSLRGWLRWIHANRSDAALRVRTREGGSGDIWCSVGKIVDAEWGKLTAEEALQEMLGLASGSVTIDFDRVDRPCRIARPTQELLHLFEARPGLGRDLTQPDAGPAASPTGRAPDQPFRNSLLPPSDAPQAISLRARPEPRRISRREYFAGSSVLAALVLTAFAFGRIRASSESEPASAQEPERAQQIKSGLLPPTSPASTQPGAPPAPATQRSLSVISFVAIEVEPADAEVWLDQALVGIGRIDLARMSDGVMHELRFVAAGHDTRSLFFLDTPPAGRVILERIGEPAARAAAVDNSEADTPSTAAEVSPANAGGGEREAVKRLPRRRAPAAPPQVRERPSADPAAATAKSTQGKPSPQIQLIEARTPRVQVLE
jgi:Domain of unknown function (DUF4388)